MTCRPKLVLGLLAALSLSPSLAASRATQAAGLSAQTSRAPHAPAAARRIVASTDGAPAAWQKRSQERQQTNAPEIRFGKPTIGGSEGSTEPSKPQVKQVVMLEGQPIRTAQSVPQVAVLNNEPPTVIASDQHGQPRRIPRVTYAPASPANAYATASGAASQLGGDSAPGVKTQTSVELEVPRSMIPLPAPESAVPPIAAVQPRTEWNASPSSDAGIPAPLNDEQLQVVSQMLLDQQVKRAAEEEPLPQSAAATAGSAQARPLSTGAVHHDGLACADECCPPPAPCLVWTAGVEATFLSPDLNSDGVSMEVEEIDDERYDLTSTHTDDVDSVYVSPRIWLGVQGCAWGANLRYWHLNASEGAFDPTIGSDNTWDGFDCGRTDLGYTLCSRLEAYTIDLELTRKFCLNDCAMQAAVGIRHAEIEHDQGLFGLANTDEGILSGFARANRLSRGTGIQLGLYGRKPLFPCSCVHWFYNARWSALWGPTETAVETFASVLTTQQNVTASAASVNGAYTKVDDTLFIGEIQLGLEWNYALQCMPANAFFRTAIEYQRWDGGLGYSASQSFAGATIVNQNDPTSIITTTASAAEPQLDLIGLSIGTGLTW